MIMRVLPLHRIPQVRRHPFQLTGKLVRDAAGHGVLDGHKGSVEEVGDSFVGEDEGWHFRVLRFFSFACFACFGFCGLRGGWVSGGFFLFGLERREMGDGREGGYIAMVSG